MRLSDSDCDSSGRVFEIATVAVFHRISTFSVIRSDVQGHVMEPSSLFSRTPVP